jgi:GTP-binding protein EngB required for normal cell division
MITLAAEESRLRDYTLAKLQVAEALRAAKQLLTGSEPDRTEELQALLVKLAEDHFHLAVVGQFKRGKSSLMNAVIGREVLPTGVLPLTSAITTLCYGPKDRVVLRHRGWALEQEVTLSELADYVTARGNPGNEREVVEARVELPVRLLRRGLHFIDTPGVGSSRQENTATTYTFLPQADAIIFVTSVDAPLSEAEERFLSDIRAHGRRLFLVVNKMDLLAPGERDAVLTYIRREVERILEADAVRLYSLSAQQGLLAKLKKNPGGLRESGLPEFEHELARFLAEERGRTFLATVLERALRVTRAHDASRSPCQGSADTAASLGNLRLRMESMRKLLVTDGPVAGARSASELGGNAEGWEEKGLGGQCVVVRCSEARRPLSDLTCAICDAQRCAVFEALCAWQYSLATNDRARRAFAAAGGFCHFHTWQCSELGSSQGLSEGYAPLIDAAAETLRRRLNRRPEEAARAISGMLARVDRCAACRVLHKTERKRVGELLAELATVEGREAYGQSPGLCLPHLQFVLDARPPDEIAECLIREQVRRLEDVAEDMRSYALKRDALRRTLLNANEENAWRRALVQLTGERTVRIG